MTMLKTRKIYYDNPLLTRHTTAWRRCGPSTVSLLESVAFPEGGGQLGDHGIVSQQGIAIPFLDTQKSYGRCVVLPDFPMIQVDGEVSLTLGATIPESWNEELPIDVEVDWDRRQRLCRSHSTAHLLYLAILHVSPEVRSGIRGCYIAPDGGRFDLARNDRFSTIEVGEMVTFVEDWVRNDYLMELETLAGEPECRLWWCNHERIPCGGTHLERTGLVGRVSINRRTKGRGLERVYFTLDD